MANWNKKSGKIEDYNITEDQIWEKLAFLYSSSMKTNTYKFGFLKALLDSLFNGKETDQGFL